MKAKASTSPGKLLLAFGLLGLGGFVFYESIASEFFGTPTPSTSQTGDDQDWEESEDQPIVEVELPETTADLLDLHGSHDSKESVPNPFLALPAGVIAFEVGSPPRNTDNPAAPAGEQAPDEPTERAPERMHVTLVMLTSKVTRAVVDARVVGVGDTVTAGTITRITREGVEVRDGTKTLFYDIDRQWPRGYTPPADADDAPDAEESDR